MCPKVTRPVGDEESILVQDERMWTTPELNCVRACLFCLVPIGWQLSHQPLFHEPSGHVYPSPMWRPIPPVVDGRGNYAYIDVNVNLLVIVSTTNVPLEGSVLPVSNSSSARLLICTPFERSVSAQANTLILINPDGTRLQVAMKPGSARLWRNELARIVDEDETDLITEVAKRCSLADQARIKEFAKPN